MNQKDKQLTSFLSMTIGSALDDYMANLANKQQESAQKIAAVEDELWQSQQEKNKFEQLVKERDKRIADLEKWLSNKKDELKEVKKESAVLEKSLEVATTKITDMEDAVSKLLSRAKTMVGHMILGESSMELIAEWNVDYGKKCEAMARGIITKEELDAWVTCTKP